MMRNFCKRCNCFVSMAHAVTGMQCPVCGERTVRRMGTIHIDRAGLREAAAEIGASGPHFVKLALAQCDQRLRRFLQEVL